ncbi:MAG TPA: HAD-IIIC family phosphatase [Verrucomicrobiae bacterium]|jgi:FkbH-like protein|nr:HAD-IIIC family phosphatase [Verrucomicrobiae bacterium]
MGPGTQNLASASALAVKRPKIKCVVWDLDNTLWNGTLLEGDDVRLRDCVQEIIQTLDARGILHSIASRNHAETALAQLRELGLEEYFLYPQIHWGSKAASIRAIGESLNIGLDTICFIDDQPFEIEEVKATLPQVLCLDDTQLPTLLQRPELKPEIITAESRKRRQMYLGDMRRKQVEEAFAGPQEEFLATLRMVFTIAPARAEDLARAEELTNRTNQLNTTARTFSQEELEELRCSNHHLLLMSELTDRFGSYGKIGLCLVECGPEIWTIKLLLMSCRVMNRGVGTIMLNHILRKARESNVRLLSEFVSNDRNRMMYVTYKFAGFNEIEVRDGIQILEHRLTSIPTDADYVKVEVLA